jgi:hypothetical protein
MEVTMGEVQSLMKEKGRELSAKYHKQNPGDISLKELKEILKNDFFHAQYSSRSYYTRTSKNNE